MFGVRMLSGVGASDGGGIETRCCMVGESSSAASWVALLVYGVGVDGLP